MNITKQIADLRELWDSNIDAIEYVPMDWGSTIEDEYWDLEIIELKTKVIVKLDGMGSYTQTFSRSREQFELNWALSQIASAVRRRIRKVNRHRTLSET